MVCPGDLVIHPHDPRRLATVLRVSGGATLLQDDLGPLTARTQALVALAADPSPDAKASGFSPGGHARSRARGRHPARAR